MGLFLLESDTLYHEWPLRGHGDTVMYGNHNRYSRYMRVSISLKPSDQFRKSQSSHVPYPTLLHSEQKCAHFCSERSILGYRTAAFWGLWFRSILQSKNREMYLDLDCHLTTCHLDHKGDKKTLETWRNSINSFVVSAESAAGLAPSDDKVCPLIYTEEALQGLMFKHFQLGPRIN